MTISTSNKLLMERENSILQMEIADMYFASTPFPSHKFTPRDKKIFKTYYLIK